MVEKRLVCDVCGHEWDAWDVSSSSLCCPKCGERVLKDEG